MDFKPRSAKLLFFLLAALIFLVLVSIGIGIAAIVTMKKNQKLYATVTPSTTLASSGTTIVKTAQTTPMAFSSSTMSKASSSPNPISIAKTSVPPSLPPLISVANGMLNFDPIQKTLALVNPLNKKLLLTGTVGHLVGSSPRLVSYSNLNGSFHIRWPETGTDLQVNSTNRMNQNGGLHTFTIKWTTEQLWKLQDAYSMSGAHWYGGAETFNQYFPLDRTDISLTAYTTNDIYKGAWGGVQERYWLSSKHLAITAPDEVPLWVGMNTDYLTFAAQHKQSVYANFVDVTVIRPSLQYTIYVPANDNSTLKDLQLSMVETYLGKPTGVPDTEMMSYPIWSTWAKYKQNISQDGVLEFVKEIFANNFNASQIEIDDRWATHYGDFKMDPAKFPNAIALVKNLTDAGLRVTLWVHPFANTDSETARNLSNAKYWVLRARELDPALLLWWDGAGVMVDPTNPESSAWFVGRLKEFQASLGLHSYKFDAGETNWLPDCFRLRNATFPNQLTRSYVKIVSELGNGIEVRVGSRTQEYPHFVRIMDKDSRWGYDNGLRAVITCVLQFGILGYPFALPDMIGGNAYTEGPNGLNGHAYPDRQLYIRWLEANVFLPGVQFSIAPWHYDEEVVKIAQNMMTLRESYKETILALAENAVQTGEPIVRPIWWTGDESESALTCDSEFLLGNDILVAPILEVNATSRSVYLPAGGAWKSSITGTITHGQQTIVENVNLDQLAYYIRQ